MAECWHGKSGSLKKDIRHLKQQLNDQQQTQTQIKHDNSTQQTLSQQLDELKQQVQTLLVTPAPVANPTPEYPNNGLTNLNLTTDLSTPLNQANKTANSSKLAMLKRLVEDNLNLRKHFN